MCLNFLFSLLSRCMYDVSMAEGVLLKRLHSIHIKAKPEKHYAIHK